MLRKLLCLLLFLVCSSAQGPSGPSGPTCVGCTRSDWTRYIGADNCPPNAQSPLVGSQTCILGFLLNDCNRTDNPPDHGDTSLYTTAVCPDFPAIPPDSNLWQGGPQNGIQDPTQIDFGCGDCSSLQNCEMNQLDVNFFESFIYVPSSVIVTDFFVGFTVDDGARVSIINSAGVQPYILNPNDGVSLGSYIFLDGVQRTGNLAPYFRTGEVNRLVITQLDDCPVGNTLASAIVYVNGAAVQSINNSNVPPVTTTPTVAATSAETTTSPEPASTTSLTSPESTTVPVLATTAETTTSPPNTTATTTVPTTSLESTLPTTSAPPVSNVGCIAYGGLCSAAQQCCDGLCLRHTGSCNGVAEAYRCARAGAYVPNGASP